MIWIKLIFIFLITFGLIALVKYFLSRIFNIKKQKKSLLKRHHVNDSHKKIDKILNITSVIVLLITLYLVVYREYTFNFFLYILIFTNAIEYTVQAFFERKYGEDPKQAILTISEISVAIIVIFVIIQFNLLFP